MITWFQMWPICLLPFFPMLLPAFLPETNWVTFLLTNQAYMGWWVDKTILSILPNDKAWLFVAWYQSTSILLHYLVHFFISINVVAALLPIMFLIGSAIIKFRNWISVSDLKSRRLHAKQ